MTPDMAVDKLRDELNFEENTAIAYVKASGRCEYCYRDLIADRLGYACAEIDHLLPKSIYPEAISDRQENYVLSCSLCNGVKRDISVLKGDDAIDMLINRRDELVNRARKVIEDKLNSANKDWKTAIDIFKSIGADPA